MRRTTRGGISPDAKTLTQCTRRPGCSILNPQETRTVDIDFSQPTQMTPEQAFELLKRWFIQKDELKTLQAAEVLARKELAVHFFPTPREGTNIYEIVGDGTVPPYELVMDHKINRTLDEALLNTLGRKLYEDGVPMDLLIEYKPQLKLAEYRKLNDAQRAAFDALLTSKEGTPTLTIRPKADDATQQRHAEHVAAAQAEAGNAPAAASASPAEGSSAAAGPELPVSIEDPDAGKKGDYYEDGEGQWWYCKKKGDWDEIPDGTLADHYAQHKPKAKSAPRKGAK